ncbi:MAG TPA: heat-inducible transcriptional repressor HrcA [Candidatus Limnocylindrales bacterium]|jgi:heat-inducible transcriptional repressor|nr:heat-inducible transcriptional repressor HrcA [Candidatus Limnocylindrales bacterium]
MTKHDQRLEAGASSRPALELTDRQRSILRAVVEDYVLTAVPVGSKALVSRYRLGVSPATVRSAMAELEAMGLLSHPHTSAGRVPSDLGYRLYVESLMREAELDHADQLMIRHQFSQVQLTSNEWLRLAASILAGSTHSASVVTPARSRRARFGHVQLVALADGTRLLVLVLADGNVVQRRLDRVALERRLPDVTLDQPSLDLAAGTLNRELSGLSGPQVRRRAAKLPGAAAPIAETVAALLDEADSVVVEDVFTDGIIHVLEQPEFAEGSKLRPILEVIQRSDFLQQLLPVLTRHGGVHVIIGRENMNDAMHEVSLVFAPYGSPGAALGMLGVLGPTRMPYPRAIPTVRYLSTLMNELISSHYGETQ